MRPLCLQKSTCWCWRTDSVRYRLLTSFCRFIVISNKQCSFWKLYFNSCSKHLHSNEFHKMVCYISNSNFVHQDWLSISLTLFSILFALYIYSISVHLQIHTVCNLVLCLSQFSSLTLFNWLIYWLCFRNQSISQKQPLFFVTSFKGGNFSRHFQRLSSSKLLFLPLYCAQRLFCLAFF